VTGVFARVAGACAQLDAEIARHTISRRALTIATLATRCIVVYRRTDRRWRRRVSAVW
jgi:hypothetical protein